MCKFTQNGKKKNPFFKDRFQHIAFRFIQFFLVLLPMSFQSDDESFITLENAVVGLRKGDKNVLDRIEKALIHWRQEADELKRRKEKAIAAVFYCMARDGAHHNQLDQVLRALTGCPQDEQDVFGESEEYKRRVRSFAQKEAITDTNALCRSKNL